MIYIIPSFAAYGPLQTTAVLMQRQKISRLKFMEEVLTQVTGRPGTASGLCGPGFVKWWVKHLAVGETSTVLTQMCTSSTENLMPWIANGLVPALVDIIKGQETGVPSELIQSLEATNTFTFLPLGSDYPSSQNLKTAWCC